MNAGNSEAASLMQLMAQAAQASPDDYTRSPVYGMPLTLLYPCVPGKPKGTIATALLCISRCLGLIPTCYDNEGS